MNQVFIEKITFRSIIIILIASCFYFYEFVVQSAPGAMAEDIMRDFAIDATKLGLISSCFYYSYAPLQIITGLLLDRYNARLILTCVSFIFSFGTLMFSVAQNIYIIAISRIILGATAASAFIGVLHLIARWIPKKYFALFAGIVEMMGAFGGAIGSFPIAIMLNHFSWRITIRILSYIGICLSFIIALIIRNQPKNIKTTYIRKNKGIKFLSYNIKKVLCNKEAWILGLYSFLIWAQMISFPILWGASFLKLSCNLDNINATKSIWYIWCGVAIASPIIGLISDYIGKRCFIMTICGIIGSISMLIVILFQNISISFLNILMFFLGFASAAQVIPFAIIRNNHQDDTSSTANGFNNMCIVSGGLIFPVLIGKIMDYNWNYSMINGVRVYTLYSYKIALSVIPICYLLSSIISYFFIKDNAPSQNK